MDGPIEIGDSVKIVSGPSNLIGQVGIIVYEESYKLAIGNEWYKVFTVLIRTKPIAFLPDEIEIIKKGVNRHVPYHVFRMPADSDFDT
jgi:hypothetical protein